MQAGALRHPMVIEAVAEGQPWTSFLPVWADLQPRAGAEPVLAQGVAADVTHDVGLRHVSGVTTAQRLRFGTRLFHIQTVRNLNERQRALALEVKEQQGVAVTFTHVTQGYEEATGRVVPVETTIAGVAQQIAGDPDHYKALGLVLSTMPTIFFWPTLGGACPQPGDTVVWAGLLSTVRDVARIAPLGLTIAARVVIGE